MLYRRYELPLHDRRSWRVPMSKAYLAGTRVNGTPVNSGVPISGTPVNVNGIASAMHSGLRALVLLCIRVHGTGTRRSMAKHAAWPPRPAGEYQDGARSRRTRFQWAGVRLAGHGRWFRLAATAETVDLSHCLTDTRERSTRERGHWRRQGERLRTQKCCVVGFRWCCPIFDILTIVY